jgi:hypothetical protein
MTLLRWACALALACLSTPIAAQTYPKIIAPSTIVPPSGVAFTDIDGSTKVASPTSPLPIAERQESVVLATANTSIAPATLYGGTYVLTQACTAYGSVALRYRAPDGTMLTLATKIVGDSGGGSTFQFGTAQIVDVLLTGTTGCNVTLSRIP